MKQQSIELENKMMQNLKEFQKALEDEVNLKYGNEQSVQKDSTRQVSEVTKRRLFKKEMSHMMG